jgi:hypothetical protein
VLTAAAGNAGPAHNTPDLTALHRCKFREARAATERATEQPLRRCIIDCDQL